VDDEVGNAGSVVFQVWDNLGNKLYDSGTMTGAAATKSINVNVTGKSEIRLIVTNADGNFDSDHGDWANARLTSRRRTLQPSIRSTAPRSTRPGRTPPMDRSPIPARVRGPRP
jgi:hypothetical protein